MNYTGGMWFDGQPTQNPPNTTRINKHVIWDRSKGILTNERGNLQITNYGDYRKPIGVIVLDRNDFVVFSKSEQYNSVIGYVNEQLEYSELKNDPSLNFSFTKPIHGAFQRTVLGEMVIAFTDNYNPVRYYNITKDTETVDMNVFTDFLRPVILPEIISGGNLLSGAWYPIVRGEKSDGTTTSWIKDYNPLYIGAATENASFNYQLTNVVMPNLPTDKAISLTVTGLDPRFRRFQVGLVHQHNGQRDYYFVRKVDTEDGTVTAIIGNFAELTQITPTEVLVDRVKYRTVEHLTQTDNTLYAQGLTTYGEPIQQSFCNQIILQWVNTVYDFNSNPNIFQFTEYNNRKRHFQHGEIYAFYIRYRYSWGFGQWWHIPGRQLNPVDRDVVYDGFQRFQIYDTTSVGGGFGAWENQSEKYPNKPYYPTGKVRHHKFPSIRWMKENVYQDEPRYGASFMDILNVQVQAGLDLGTIKDNDGELALGYEIGYAKRDESNSSVVGQSIFVSASDFTATLENVFSSMGMNANHANEIGDERRAVIDTSRIRTYDYSMLYNKRAYNTNYIRSEVVLQGNITFSDKATDYDYTNLRYGVAPFTANNAVLPTDNITKVRKALFVANNTKLGEMNNTFLEDTVVLQLEQGLGLPVIPNITRDPWPTGIVEYTQLITMLNIRRDMYAAFTSQVVIPCDEDKYNQYHGGDTYINVSSIVTFGNTGQLGSRNDPAASDEFNTATNGTRIANFFLSESQYNLAFRYVNPTVLGGSTLFYPHDQPEIYLPYLLRNEEPNLLIAGYSKDYNAQNDLTTTDIFNPLQLETRTPSLPFAAIRGQRYEDGQVITPWITFTAELYQLERTRGRIVNFIAIDDRLLIHHENALMITKPNSYMDASGEAVFIGVGDLFKFPPQEVIHSELGSLGTQHKWACLVNQYGYFFIDANTGLYIKYDSQPKVLSGAGLREFFNENSFCPADNPFNGYGYSSAYDQLNERILLTKKHKRLLPEYQKRYKGIWRNEEKFLNSLSIGDIVYKQDEDDYFFITQ